MREMALNGKGQRRLAMPNLPGMDKIMGSEATGY